MNKKANEEFEQGFGTMQSFYGRFKGLAAIHLVHEVEITSN